MNGMNGLEHQSVLAYPQSSFYFPTAILDHLGLRMLAGMLESKGIRTKVLLQGGFKLSAERLVEEILESGPFMVGISPTMMSWDVCKEIVQKVKEVSPSIHFVMGGHLASFTPNEILRGSLADSVVVGYGCDPILQLAQAILRGESLIKVDSLYWKAGRQIIVNPVGKCSGELSVLPSMEPIGRLASSAFLPAATAATSIGCPNKCEFCTTAAMGRFYSCPLRHMDIGMVIGQFERLEAAGIKYCLLTDDNFFQSKNDRARAELIAKEKMRKNIQLNFAFMATACDLVDPDNLELLRVMRRAGAIGVLVGAEACDPRSLESVGKNEKVTTPSANIAVSDLLRREELLMLTTFININPYSTAGSLKANAEGLMRMGAATFANLTSALMMLPGTVTTKKAAQGGILLPDYDPLSTPYAYRIFDNTVEPFARALLAMRRWTNPEVKNILSLAQDMLLLSFGIVMRRRGLADLQEPRRQEYGLNFNFFMDGLKLAESGWDRREWEALVAGYDQSAKNLRLRIRRKYGQYMPSFLSQGRLRF